MRRFALSSFLPASMLLVLASCAGPQQPFLYDGKPTIRVAKAAMTSGAPEVALNVANSILDTKPNDVPALLIKGDALYALGLFALSQSSYQEVLKLQPANGPAHLGVGRIKLSDHDPKTAEAEFRAALRVQPQPETISDLGVALDLQRRPLEAQAEYRRALNIDPGSVATRVDLARSLLSTGNVDEARTVLQPAVQTKTLLSPDVAAVQRAIDLQSGGMPDAGVSQPDAVVPAVAASPTSLTPSPEPPARTRAPRAVQ